MNSTETPEGTTEPRCDAPPCVACSRTTWHVHLAALSAATPGADEGLREQIHLAVGSVLWNASNYPERVQSRMLGQDTAPLREKVADAVWAVVRPTLRPSPGVVDLRPGGDDARVVTAEAEAHRLRAEVERLAERNRSLRAAEVGERSMRLAAENQKARAEAAERREAALRERIEALRDDLASPVRGTRRSVTVGDLRALLADTAGAPRTDAS